MPALSTDHNYCAFCLLLVVLLCCCVQEQSPCEVRRPLEIENSPNEPPENSNGIYLTPPFVPQCNWMRNYFLTSNGDIFAGLMKFSGKTFDPISICRVADTGSYSPVTSYYNESEDLLYALWDGSVYVFNSDCELTNTVRCFQYPLFDESLPERPQVPWHRDKPDLLECDQLLFASEDELYFSDCFSITDNGETQDYWVSLVKVKPKVREAHRIYTKHGANITLAHPFKPLFVATLSHPNVPGSMALGYERLDASSVFLDCSKDEVLSWPVTCGSSYILDGRVSIGGDRAAVLTMSRDDGEARLIQIYEYGLSTLTATVKADNIIGFETNDRLWTSVDTNEKKELKEIDVRTGKTIQSWNCPTEDIQAFKGVISNGQIIAVADEVVGKLDLHSKTVHPEILDRLKKKPGRSILYPFTPGFSTETGLYFGATHAYAFAFNPVSHEYWTQLINPFVPASHTAQIRTDLSDGTACLVTAGKNAEGHKEMSCYAMSVEDGKFNVSLDNNRLDSPGLLSSTDYRDSPRGNMNFSTYDRFSKAFTNSKYIGTVDGQHYLQSRDTIKVLNGEDALVEQLNVPEGASVEQVVSRIVFAGRPKNHSGYLLLFNVRSQTWLDLKMKLWSHDGFLVLQSKENAYRYGLENRSMEELVLGDRYPFFFFTANPSSKKCILFDDLAEMWAVTKWRPSDNEELRKSLAEFFGENGE